MTKDSLIKGTLILAAAAFIARFLGVIQRIPLQALLDDAGMATYGIAYNVYFPLLIIATAGIPSALSKLISEKNALGQYDEAQRIFRAAIWFSITAGIVMTAILYVGAPYYAQYVSLDPDSALAIRALAPAMLMFPLIAILRGYFQGLQMMKAGGMSQIVEQILRVITAVGLAYMLLVLGYSDRIAIAGASFGGVMGGVGALGVMLYYWRKLKRANQIPNVSNVSLANPVASEATNSMVNIYKKIFKYAIPISLISLAVPLINFIDSSVTIPLLKDQLGYDQAKDTLGILAGRAQSLAGIPIILAIALSQSIVPIVSSAFARKDHLELSNKTSLTLRIAVISGLPAVIALATAARPINGLLFADTDGTYMIIALIIASLFQIMMMTSGAILMGFGEMKAPTIHVFVGIAVKLVLSFALAPFFGIYGIIAATLICFIVTMQLNLRVLKRIVEFSILGKRTFGMMLNGFASAAVGALVVWLMTLWMPEANRFIYFIQAAVVGTLVLIVYGVLLFLLRLITHEDVQAFPRPLRNRIIRFIK